MKRRQLDIVASTTNAALAQRWLRDDHEVHAQVLLNKCFWRQAWVSQIRKVRGTTLMEARSWSSHTWLRACMFYKIGRLPLATLKPDGDHALP